ncbi:Membrane-bound lytic murein transglycosylase A precursor [Pannonibacter phragmitetus]|uniref:peptidoglycan lytic exotransglycosylase n=1 Tax=Pannonibacter phragmitetus TaxID=121719 RepID=A0A379A315_9HYPH|nr:MltA domain-containing protein [Pannonibacter phragmitetus]SUB03161.1 Membrane-bound lytic murein transglycosylase A precursor [Pannonibacter phragmitetus]
MTVQSAQALRWAAAPAAAFLRLRRHVLPGLAVALCLWGTGGARAMTIETALPLKPADFSSLPGWTQDDHLAAIQAFLRFCAGAEQGFAGPAALQRALTAACRKAQEEAPATDAAARAFFEREFRPYHVASDGFVTAYFEPEVRGARQPSPAYSTPLYRAPEGLSALKPENAPKGLAGLTHALKTEQGFHEMPDRGAIMDGVIKGRGLELVWLADPIDAYFVHVQGSTRIRLEDGSVMRAGYAGKTGHPYTAIGKVLVEAGEGTPEDFTMQGLRAWLKANPERMDGLFRRNRSFIFFREVTEVGPELGPIGAAGLPLVPGRSLAIDPRFHSYGLPVFVGADLSGAGLAQRQWQRLMIADDTGSAIRGAARGDIFMGSGDAAGVAAGAVRHKASFTILLPRVLTPKPSGQGS